MIFAPAIVEVKPADLTTTSAAITVDAADLADDFGPADDDAQWDAWADEAATMDLMEAGLGTW